MFDDILKDNSKTSVLCPSYLEICYFKDGEGMEYDVSITDKELIGSLPLFTHKPMSREKIELLVETIKWMLLIDKCLLFSTYVV